MSAVTTNNFATMRELSARSSARTPEVRSFMGQMPNRAALARNPIRNTSATEASAVIASNLQEAVKTSDHQMSLAAIQTTESRMEAAAKLGISPRTLRYKLAKLKAENGNMAWAA